MEEPDFWNDPERSQEFMKELKSKKDDVEIYRQLTPDGRYGTYDRDGI